MTKPLTTPAQGRALTGAIQRHITEGEKMDAVARKIEEIKAQTGIHLTADSYFTGMKTHRDVSYFNVELEQRTTESRVFEQLERYAASPASIIQRIEPNGLNRIAVFIK